jgi:hypothetical protein
MPTERAEPVLAALAYRMQKALRGAPDGFGEFRAAARRVVRRGTGGGWSELPTLVSSSPREGRTRLGGRSEILTIHMS